MLDFSHIPTPYGAADVQTFTGNTTVAGGSWKTWTKPRGKSMCNILLVGAGGSGGSGAIGANSTAAGGGGGSSGAQAVLTMPLWAIPDVLFLSLAHQGLGVISYISIIQSTVANHTIALANAGANGGNASGATAGNAGGAATAPSAANMPLGFAWADALLAGSAGIIGGTTVAGANLTIPVTGLYVTGGTGGGGLPAAAASGTAGGSFTVPAAPSPFVEHAGGAIQATATLPANNGSNGYSPVRGLLYGYGGTGGGSTHGTATGGGLVASIGGNGGLGCGGGGGGGALTGSTAGRGGLGGSAFCVITCW